MSPSTTSRVTTDHEEIRQWAEVRGATPAAVARTESDGDPGIIRLEFPGVRSRNDDALEQIGWDAWLKKFDRNKLAFLYQHETANGERSNFNEIIRRDTVEEVHAAVGGRGRSATHKRVVKRPKPASRTHIPSEGREETTRRSSSARGRTSSSGHASTRSRSGGRRQSDATRGGATRGSAARSSRTTSRAGEVPAD